MNNAEIIQHQGTDILVMDLSNITPIEVIKRIKAVEEKIVEFPYASVFLLVCTTKLPYNSITSANLNEFSSVYGKYIKSSVILDEEFSSSSDTSSSNEEGPKKSKILSNKTEALDWLISQ